MLKKRAGEPFEIKGATVKKERPAFSKVIVFLAGIFFIIWITIGIFLALVIVQGIRRGDFMQLISSKRQTQEVEGAQAQTETTLPGVGRVNIACVQESLSAESIQKLVSSGDASFLQGEEKTKFDACVVEAEANPESQNQ